MFILGLSAFYHDSAACLLKDGEIIAAAQEERFSRKKFDASFPYESIKYVLSEANIKLNEVDFIVFHEKPFLKFERLLETYIAFAPYGFRSFIASIPIWLREKLFQKKFIFESLKKIDDSFNNENKIKFSEHHLSHAASAFFPSPFEEAIILTLDGVGEWSTSTICIGKKNKIEILKEINFPHSLGLLYSAFTYYLGFKINSGEYKVMGLAPYGKPKYKDIILNNLIDLKKDGSFRLNMKYFNYTTGLTMTNQKFANLFEKGRRDGEKDKLEQFHMDVASSIQKVLEEIILKITKDIRSKYKIENICLAGGVALNCVANGKIIENKIFKNIWIQPAAGDSGCSLGASLAFWYIEQKKNRIVNKEDNMKGSLLGPKFTNEEIKKYLENNNIKYEYYDFDELINLVANELSKNKILGLFNGKMEFGPRALGSRSIIADPRSKDMQKNLNLKIKYRESFRPFAPIILEEKLNEYFKLDQKSPYMLLVSEIKEELKIKMNDNEKELFGLDRLNKKRSTIPSVTHVDYTSRIQTVNQSNNFLYSLLKKFNEITHCPVLINTSFNIRGEPIVCTPEDAFKCFMGTELDILVIENFIIRKENQNKSIKDDYRSKFELD